MKKTSGQLRLTRKPVFISGEKEKEILEYFKTNHDNRTSVVAKHFEVSEHQVSRIIDVHFDRTRVKK